MESNFETDINDFQSFKHITLKSKKYEIQYELIWSEKFINSVSSLNNRTFTSIIKKLKDIEEKLPRNIEFGEKCLLISKLNKSNTEVQINYKSNELQEYLINEIETDRLASDFEQKIELDESN